MDVEGKFMIRNDRELLAAQAQIANMQRALADLRRAVTVDEFRLVARSSRLMIERMQREVLDYLTKVEPRTESPANVMAARA